ncbi:unnamed protein product [Effrenium voratum]|nr:unnamed protein product [Effrenium voratum]
MSDVGKAIKSNRNSATAHNDLLIPVRCKATGKLEFIAAQCRYGEKKDAGGLKLQDKAKKDNFEEKKHSPKSCETIIAQLDVLKLL